MAPCRKWLLTCLSTLFFKGIDIPNLDSATSEALTASESSIGNSGGTTLVMIRTQSSSNLDFFRSLSIPIRPSHEH